MLCPDCPNLLIRRELATGSLGTRPDERGFLLRRQRKSRFLVPGKAEEDAGHVVLRSRRKRADTRDGPVEKLGHASIMHDARALESQLGEVTAMENGPISAACVQGNLAYTTTAIAACSPTPNTRL